MHAWLHLSFLFKAHLKPKDEVICVAVLPRASNLIYCDYDNFIYNLPCIYLKLDANVCGLIVGVTKKSKFNRMLVYTRINVREKSVIKQSYLLFLRLYLQGSTANILITMLMLVKKFLIVDFK